MRGLSATDLRKLREDVGDLIESHRGSGEDFTAYADDPVGFIRDVLEVTDPGLWSGQIEVAEAVRDRALVVVRGCNGAGKDFVSACLALWWVYARRGLALLTGPTERQVREIVMQEVARLFHRSKRLPGELFQMALRVGGEEDEAQGILAFTSRDASRLTGFHAPRVFVLITEAQGVEDFAYEAALSCAVSEHDRILAVGNPLAPSGRFYDVSSRSQTWRAIRLPASEHPNVVEGCTVIPGAISPQFVERMAAEYGVGSGTYRARVEAEFPDEGEESLLSRRWLEAAAVRLEEGEFAEEAEKAAPVVSVDPARYGPDSTALAVRRGPVLERTATWHGKSTTETVERVVAELKAEGVKPGVPNKYRELPPHMLERLPKAYGDVIVDSVGIGAGVVDQLRARGYRVTAYNGGQFTGSRDRDKYFNERARSHWHLRKLLEDGKIALPRNQKLFDELMAVNWTPTTDGKIQIERKAAMKSRLGRSPDLGDAVVMAFAIDANRTFVTMAPGPWG